MADRSLSPWVVMEWPDEATPADVDDARHALADSPGQDGPVSVEAMAAAFGVTGRTVQRWRRHGVDGFRARVIHAILWFDEHNVRLEVG